MEPGDGFNLMAAKAGNLAFQGLPGLKEALEAQEIASKASESGYKSEEFHWAESLPLRSSVASTACTDSDPPHKQSLDFCQSPKVKAHFFPTSRAACHSQRVLRMDSDLFDSLSAQDVERAFADLKSLQGLVEGLEAEIENICLREWNKPVRQLKCVALPETSTLMRRRSTNV